MRTRTPEYYRQWARKNKEKLKQEGRCQYCRQITSHRYSECPKRHIKPKGRCHCCPRPAVKGKSRCLDCAERNKVQARRLKYGLSEEAYRELEDRQRGDCPFCELPLSVAAVHVDHDHKTGKVRGLLHRRCNLDLGIIEKWLHRIDSVKEYLNGAA